MKIQIFDPPMCCPTGVCGPSVDPELVRFAADLEWLSRQGVAVERYNLAQQPGAFVAAAVVREALAAKGDACLPLTLADGAIGCEGRYPKREELAELAGLGAPEPQSTLIDDAVDELMAISASMAANSPACFRRHYAQARKLGVSKEDIARAAELGQWVQEEAARAVAGVAAKYRPDAEPIQSCCGPAAPAKASGDGEDGTRKPCC